MANEKVDAVNTHTAIITPEETVPGTVDPTTSHPRVRKLPTPEMAHRSNSSMDPR
jgi:hypothetical protein